MYVCVCKALTERDVHTAVAQGCNSLKGLRGELGLGSECGRCTGCAKSLLKEVFATAAQQHAPQVAA
ncbi:MAG TPA: (2Fe-2S)-binding protein [Rhodocyclaceae bacterium]